MQEAPSGLSTYELMRWAEIQEWRQHVSKPSRVRLPSSARKVATGATDRIAHAWSAVPGNDNVERWIAEAINGSFHMTIDVVSKTVKEDKIVRKVNRKSPQQVNRIDEFLKLDLFPLDEACPDQKMLRSFIAAGHGGASGFVAGGAAAAGAASGGMAALPAAATVAGLAVLDAATLVGSMTQASALIGAHYGFDPRKPREHALLMSVLGAGLATQAGKTAALMRVRELALALAARKTLDHLSKKYLFTLIRRIYALLLLNTAKRNIAKGVPFVGIGLGAGINYGAIRKVVDAGEPLYPERFLVVKYPGEHTAEAEPVDVDKELSQLAEEADAGVIDRLEQLPLSDTESTGEAEQWREDPPSQ